jgi:cytochrome c oxidase subunit 2
MPKHPLVRMFLYGAIASVIGVAIIRALDWFPAQGSEDSKKIDLMYDVLMYVSFPIFILVMTVAIYSVIVFRARPGDTRDGAPIHGNARLEVIWVLVPFIIVSVLAAYAWIVLDEIETPKKGELIVHVFGQQFAWSYEYRGKDGKPIRSTELYLPKDKPVKFTISSRDVIHSFWIDAFRLKSDAVPGIETEWRATPNRLGRFRVICAELCGAGHSAMRASANVVPAAEFDRWLAKQQGGPSPAVGGGGAGAASEGGPAESMSGEQLFTENGCGGCHQLAKARTSGQTGPSLDELAASARKNGRGKSPEEYVREAIVNPNAFVVPGFPEGTMPQNFGEDLTPEQIDALVAYLLGDEGGSGE